MAEIILNHVNEFTKIVNSGGTGVMYRGQSRSDYELKSSLERMLDKDWSSDSVSRYEDYALNQFKSKFHLYDKENIEPKTTLAWLSLMQHYGVPTRLLDFTTSPYVALYFALESSRFTDENDYAIYSIDYRNVLKLSVEYLNQEVKDFNCKDPLTSDSQEQVFEDYLFTNNYPIAWVAEPLQLNRRLDLQQGTFLMSASRNHTLMDVLNLPIYQGNYVDKYILPPNSRSDAYSILRKVNVTSKTLYADLAGLAGSVRMELLAYVQFDGNI